MPQRRLSQVSSAFILSSLLAASIFLFLATVPTQAVSPDRESSLQSRLVCFVSGGQAACVERPALSSTNSITAEIQALTQLLIAGPTAHEQAQGVQSALPDNAQLGYVTANEQQVAIGLILPDDFLRVLTAEQVEDINLSFHTTFMPYDFQRIEIDARGGDGGYRLLSDFLPKIEIPRKESSPAFPSPKTTSSLARESGGLSGKTVFVSAGHGWYWNTTFNTYRTQRPPYPDCVSTGEGLIEDFNNAEAVNQYLLTYLWNSGADAWTVRERDMNTHLLIVDDGDAGFSTQGAWALESGGYNGSSRSTTTVNSSPTATATWSFAPPATDIYAVYVRFPNLSATRTVDARFFVQHAGAVTPITITQARDGNNWRFIGRYPFYGGQPAYIRLTNQSNTPGVTVMADAIRIGGGTGDTSVAGAPPSSKPRWEEQARQYAKWVGMPNVDDLNDVIVRPVYSEWEKESGEDAVYLSWHTNGDSGCTNVRGTESYVYLTPTAHSLELQSAVHTALLDAIHASWDAGWPDRGKRTRDLGEVRELSTMPGILLENGFHDNPIDADAMKDPRFLQLSARAVYHGLVNYWHALDPNVPLVYLPEPPRQAMMRNSAPGQITIEWQPGPTDGSGSLGDAATSYRVYTSTDGFGWSNPIEVGATTHTLTDLAPNQLIFVKISGVNAGGESFTTPVLAARTPVLGSAPVLIVYGFERIDQAGDTQQNDYSPGGLSRRVFVDRINRFDYVIQHAEAITLPFDSALHAAVSNGMIGLGNYAVVDWIAGEEQPPFPSLTAADQTALTNFLNNGGALFISGAEIGFELKSTPFYANTLRASFVGDDAGTYAATSAAGGIFDGLGALNFDDGTHGTYDVDWPDVFNPINGAVNALVYNTGGPAALQYAAGSCTRLIYFGFPFETLYPLTQRRAVMSRIMDFFGPRLAVEVQITSPFNQAQLNIVPPFTGIAGGCTTGVQVSIRRVSDGFFYNGSSFVNQPEIWLDATGVSVWSYPLPTLTDGEYALRARAVAPAPIGSLLPTAITFTLDTVPPETPTLITPTNGITLLAVAPHFEWSGGGNPARFILEVDGIATTVQGATPGVTHVVTDGLHSWRVRAVDAAGNQSGWSAAGQFSTTSLKVHLPLVLKDNQAPPPPPTCYEAIVNGGFETGDFTGWSRPSPNPLAAVVTDPVYSGSYAVRVGAATISDPISVLSYSSVRQSLIVPAKVLTATLTFARYRWSGDTTGDLQYLAVMRGVQTLGFLFKEGAADLNWNVVQFDLKSYAGQTIDLLFSVMNDGSGGSSGMALDDVQTQICVP